jgi:hypothetical protein
MKISEFLRSFVRRGGNGQAAGELVEIAVNDEVVEVPPCVVRLLNSFVKDRNQLCDEVQKLRFELGEAHMRLCVVQAAGQQNEVMQ